ncbi:hypothetical protein FRC14_000159 [Serendipita sp. 396]|nr:hypothetical protein FRC14_000159 [Serendipita sp. 396]KAG8776070.1 hypothetical protein FRC15_012140 [Serendipita sp. 397]KAG8792379.1 hypothetical protein FRC16_011430 [Serendipita sp. 398]KAG8832096.1 hypothetical protein FRC18_005505 [Serendipita sp. 400]KAG8858666.1 hypothetical protein FRC20_011968 [Serendipita sp. 405]
MKRTYFAYIDPGNKRHTKRQHHVPTTSLNVSPVVQFKRSRSKVNPADLAREGLQGKWDVFLEKTWLNAQPCPSTACSRPPVFVTLLQSAPSAEISQECWRVPVFNVMMQSL